MMLVLHCTVGQNQQKIYITGCLPILESLTLKFNFSDKIEFYRLKIVQEMYMDVVFVLQKQKEILMNSFRAIIFFSEKTQKLKMK